jgi:hypothetical protein|nr:MAG TPA: hypothetical protein [Caudoviricetes sp.]
MRTITELNETDCVILKSNGQMLKFDDGQIVIYGQFEEAVEDLEVGEMAVLVKSLSAEQRTELIRNIQQFNS